MTRQGVWTGWSGWVLVGCAATIGWGLVTTAQGADWPQYRGPNRDGKSAETNWLQQWPPVEIWRKTIGPGFSSVVVSEGRLYVTGMEGGCTPAYTNGTNVLYCYDAQTGSEIWTHREVWDNSIQVPGYSYMFACPKSTPTVWSNEVYTFEDPGILYCFDKVTGAKLWSTNIMATGTAPEAYGYSSSPFIEGDLIILNAGGHGTAVNRNPPHNIVWPAVADTNWAGYASPAAYTVDGKRCITMFQCYNNLGLVGMDMMTGQILWTTNTWCRQLSEDALVLGDKIYTTMANGMLLQPGTNSMKVLWQGRATPSRFDRNSCAPVAHGDQLYYLSCTAGTEGSVLECFDIADGSSRWKKSFDLPLAPSGGYEALAWGSMILADGWLLMASRHDLWVVRATPDGYDDGGRAPIRVASYGKSGDWIHESYSTPALVNGRIYYRLYDQLVCYQVAPKMNRAPVARNDAAMTRKDTAATIAVLANDSDEDFGDVVTISALTQPGHGTTVLNGGTNVTYTPAAGYTGADSFAYTATDGCGGFAAGAVSILVAESGTGLAVAATATPTNGWTRSLTVQFATTAGGGQTSVTNDTTDDGTGLADASDQPSTSYRAFDNDANTSWSGSTNRTTDGTSWIQYTYQNGQRKRVEEYTITAGYPSGNYVYYYPKAWKLLGSNDRGATWAELDSRSGQTFTALQKKRFTVANPGSYATYRLRVLDTHYYGYCYLYEIELLEKGYVYAWSFGDGTTSALQNPVHTYAASGNYLAQVVVTDVLGAKATNSFWVSVSVPVTTGLPPMKMRIALDGYDRPEPLTNFPVLVTLGENVGGSGLAYSQFASPYGWDLRFKDESETTELNCEIESWNTNGASTVWVRMPALTNHAAIWAYWGDSSLAFWPATCMTNGAVWDNGFRGVWHLDALNDSTGSKNNVTNSGYTSTQLGIIGNGRYSSSDKLVVGDSSSLSVTNSITLEGWVRMDSQPSGTGNLFSKDGSSSYQFWYTATNAGVVLNDGSGAETNSWPYSFSVGKWYHTAMVADLGPAKQVRFYVNGVQIGAGKGTAKNRIADTAGALLLMQPYYYGTFDELRITGGVRSDNWLWASWRNVASNGACASFGAAQSVSGGTDAYGIPYAWKVQYFGSTNASGSGALDDPDHDGMSNYAEWRAGTVPTNAASRLQVSGFRCQGGSDLVIEWPSVAGRWYAIQGGTNLLLGFPEVISNHIPATPVVNTTTVRTDQAVQRFYRVNVE